jgi:hypothetical protein
MTQLPKLKTVENRTQSPSLPEHNPSLRRPRRLATPVCKAKRSELLPIEAFALVWVARAGGDSVRDERSPFPAAQGSTTIGPSGLCSAGRS